MEISKLLNFSKNQCFICNKYFKWNSYLKKHVKGAHGPKYKCNLCNKTMPWYAGNINYHLKKYHSF